MWHQNSKDFSLGETIKTSAHKFVSIDKQMYKYTYSQHKMAFETHMIDR